MNRLKFPGTLLASLALTGLALTTASRAETVRVPIRTANALNQQLDQPLVPAPLPASPSPLEPQPAFVPSPVGGPLPAPPVPDQPTLRNPASGGGAMYNRPLGSDFQRPEAPKKVYPGDPGALSPRSNPQSLVPFDPTPPGSPATPGLIGLPMPGATDRHGFAPPPGTLGQTYHRRSRLIDDDKHPRMAGVDVHLSENYDVSAKGLKSKWTGKVWHLSTDTLLPGIPHIYEVVAEWGPEETKQRETRSVRLIMNRVVDLEF